MKEIVEFDKWLKSELKSQGISGQKLAEKAGIARQTIYTVCHGEHKTNATVWMLIVEALGYRIRLEKEDK